MFTPDQLFIELRVAVVTYKETCSSAEETDFLKRYQERAQELERLTDKYRYEFIELITKLQKLENTAIAPPLHLKD